MDMILSADRSWGIGKSNKLLFKTAGDMKYFREKTIGKAVVMGRRTLESLPHKRPLPGRHNIVITRNPAFICEGVTVCTSLKSLFVHLEAFDDNEIMVIGGEQIYRMLMPYCSRAYITKWQAEADADCFVPNFDEAPGWRLTYQSAFMQESEVEYNFCVYEQDCPRQRNLLL